MVRLGKNEHGEIVYRNARPCRHCLEIIRQYGIRRVYYTIPNESGYLSFEVERVRDMISTTVSYGNRNFFGVS